MTGTRAERMRQPLAAEVVTAAGRTARRVCPAVHDGGRRPGHRRTALRRRCRAARRSSRCVGRVLGRPVRCGWPSAGRAGTWTTNPTSRRTRRPRNRRRSSPCAPTWWRSTGRRSIPGRPATPTSCGRRSTRRTRNFGNSVCVAGCPHRTARLGGRRSGRPSGGRTRRTCLGGRSPSGLWGGSSPGKFRPSMFVTLTCDTYGRVRDDGTPGRPDQYDYRRAARDAVHFSVAGGPVVAEPSAGRRVGRPVLRDGRTAEAGGAAPACGGTRVDPARGDQAGHGGDVSPGVVAGA